MNTTETTTITSRAADDAAAAPGRVITAVVTPFDSGGRHDGGPFDGDRSGFSRAGSVSGMTLEPRRDQ